MKAEVYAEFKVSSLSVLSQKVQKCLEETARLFGSLLEREINVRQMLHLVHAQLAFLALILLGGISALVALLLMACFTLSVVQCARAMRNE